MPPELDQDTPEMDQDMPDMDTNPSLEGPAEHGDQEGAMAKQELIKLANYATNLQEHIEDNEQLEAWVQSKITIAATNIASVYHYMAYEKKIGEYGDALDSAPISESQKRVLKFRLNEAKEKLKALKQADAAKMAENAFDWKNKKEEENGDYEKKSSTGGTTTKKGNTITHKANTDRFTDEPYDSSKDRTKSHAKARSSADKAGERAQDKADEKESKAWGKANPGKQTIHKDGKTSTNEAKMAPGHMAHHHACEYSKHHKSGNLELAMHHKEACESCGGSITHGGMGETYHSHPGINGGGIYECPGNVVMAETKKSKKVDEAAKPDFLDMDKDGNKKETMKKAVADKKKGAVKEAAKWRDPKHKDKLYTQEPRDENDYGSDDDYYNPKPDDYPGAKNLKGGGEYDHNDPLRAGYGRYGVGSLNTHGKRKGMPSRDHITSLKGSIKDAHGKHPHPNLPEAAKPSAGLSKAKKSAVVKDAKAGKDIGKPGKSFDKVAKSAGGGEKGKKIAAAAMWKNIKETQMYVAEKAKAVKDLPGKQEKLDVDKDGKLEKSDFAALRAGKKTKETVKESTDFTRMQEQIARLNRSEKPALVENREVDQIRALTKRLLG